MVLPLCRRLLAPSCGPSLGSQPCPPDDLAPFSQNMIDAAALNWLSFRAGTSLPLGFHPPMQPLPQNVLITTYHCWSHGPTSSGQRNTSFFPPMYGQSCPVLMSSALNDPEWVLKSGSLALNAQLPTAHLGFPLKVLLPVLKSPQPQNGSVPFQSLEYIVTAVMT